MQVRSLQASRGDACPLTQNLIPQVAVAVTGPEILTSALCALLNHMPGIMAYSAQTPRENLKFEDLYGELGPSPGYAHVLLLACPSPDDEFFIPSDFEGSVGGGAGRMCWIGPGRSVREMENAISLGAQGFFSLHDDVSVLRDGLALTARGQGFCSPRLVPVMVEAVRKRREEPDAPDVAGGTISLAGGEALQAVPCRTAEWPQEELTSREQEVASLAARGHSNKEIAARLHISVATVKGHLGEVFAKRGLKRRGQLAVLALSAE